MRPARTTAPGSLTGIARADATPRTRTACRWSPRADGSGSTRTDKPTRPRSGARDRIGRTDMLTEPKPWARCRAVKD